jgi:putative hydrolase of the HAD superfamily
MIFFDLDDTLVDHSSAMTQASAHLHAHLARDDDLASFRTRWLRASELIYPRYVAGEIDRHTMRRERARQVLGPLTDAQADALFDVYFSRYQACWRAFDDVQPALDALRGERLGVITNGAVVEQNAKLDRLGLRERFEVVITSEGEGVGKPDPRIFQRACAHAGQAPMHVVHVGDHPLLDANGARDAGLVGVLLDRQRIWPDHAPPCIGSLRELPALLRAHRAAGTS